MDDGPVTTVLPKELRLGAPPTMPQARSYLFRQQSTLSSYDPSQTIQINIPRLQRSYLAKDSYLQFRLNGQFKPDPNTISNVAGSGSTMIGLQFESDLMLDDAGAWGLFEKIEILDYLGSTILESTEGVPQLISLLIDMGSDFTDPDHEGPLQHGLEPQYVTNVSRTTQESGAWYYSRSGTPVSLTITSSNNTITFTGGATGNEISTFTVPVGTYSSVIRILEALYSNDKVPAGYAVSTATTDSSLIEFKSPYPFTVSGTGATNLALGAIATSYNAKTDNVTGNNQGIGVQFYNGGAALTSAGVSFANTTTYDFSVQYSIPLPSFLGFLSKKMVPLHNGFTIMLTIADKYKPMFQAAKDLPFIEILSNSTATGGAGNVYQSGLVTQGMNLYEPGDPEFDGDGKLYAPANLKDPTIFWWQLTDVAMVCHILELGPVAESMLLSTTQGQPLILHTKQMRYYRGNSTATQSEFNLPLNLNVASLTNILWFMRPDGTDDKLNFQSVGLRHRNFLQRWEFQYGSTTLPQSNGIQAMYMAAPSQASGATAWTSTKDLLLNGYTECVSELLQARPVNPSRGRLSKFNINHSYYTGLGSQINYPHTPYKTAEIDRRVQLTSPPGKFACGLNTELVRGKTGDLICGLNTNGMNTSIRGYFHPNYLTDTDKLAVTIDAYAEYDAFINISPGIATTVSF